MKKDQELRSPVLANPAESEENFESTKKKVSSLNGGAKSKKKLGVKLTGPSVYGLRENPKKTWRAVDSTFPLPQENICKQCGKGFQSLKALCGHMAYHSEKGRDFKNVMDSYSDVGADDMMQQKRTKNKRYKKFFGKSPYFSLPNGSSSVSEIDEQEQENVAMCLIMLSRDSGNWVGLNSSVEYSDNNSVILESKSSSSDVRIDRKVKSCVFDAESVEFENSLSGSFQNGAKKVESDISVDDFLRKVKYKKQPKESGGSRFKVSDSELGKAGKILCTSSPPQSPHWRELCALGRVFHTDISYETEVRKDLIKEKGYGALGITSKSMKNDSRKTTLDGYSDIELCKNVHKRSKYECLKCNKTFNSHQALGGHRPCHKKINACFSSRHETSEKLGESFRKKKPNAKDLSHDGGKRFRLKNSKGHECPICLKVFKSGQALGGHKRSHFIGGSEYKSNQTLVIKKGVPEILDLIDLNLPAPVEDEADGQAQFIPW